MSFRNGIVAVLTASFVVAGCGPGEEAADEVAAEGELVETGV